MSDEVRRYPRSGCLIYDSHCRLCVAVKQRLEQRSSTVQFLPYTSQEATEYLGSRHQSDSRPPMAYWIDEQGRIVGGLEAFFPFLHGLTSGKIILFLWRFRLCRQAMTAGYEFVARYRYRWFGSSEEP